MKNFCAVLLMALCAGCATQPPMEKKEPRRPSAITFSEPGYRVVEDPNTVYPYVAAGLPEVPRQAKNQYWAGVLVGGQKATDVDKSPNAATFTVINRENQRVELNVIGDVEKLGKAIADCNKHPDYPKATWYPVLAVPYWPSSNRYYTLDELEIWVRMEVEPQAPDQAAYFYENWKDIKAP